jgi:polyisoprenoid-binding protein YceI
LSGAGYARSCESDAIILKIEISVKAAEVNNYGIDARRSRFIVHGRAEGLLSMFGHDPLIAVSGFGGNVKFVKDTLESASLLMLVKADSLTVMNKMSEKDRTEMERAMREEVLEAARYPEIVFISTHISATRKAEDQYEARIAGNLSLHGVTREQLINAQLTVAKDSLRATGEFGLRQSDYNFKPVTAVGGALKVKDDLTLSFDIEAHA